jgi:hypothetical protein
LFLQIRCGRRPNQQRIEENSWTRKHATPHFLGLSRRPAFSWSRRISGSSDRIGTRSFLWGFPMLSRMEAAMLWCGSAVGAV